MRIVRYQIVEHVQLETRQIGAHLADELVAWIDGIGRSVDERHRHMGVIERVEPHVAVLLTLFYIADGERQHAIALFVANGQVEVVQVDGVGLMQRAEHAEEAASKRDELEEAVGGQVARVLGEQHLLEPHGPMQRMHDAAVEQHALVDVEMIGIELGIAARRDEILSPEELECNRVADVVRHQGDATHVQVDEQLVDHVGHVEYRVLVVERLVAEAVANVVEGDEHAGVNARARRVVAAQ